MQTWRSLAAGVGVMVVLAGASACVPTSEWDREGSAMLERVRAALAAEPADSDAAVILSRALAEASSAAPERRAAALSQALQQAEAARHFALTMASPLTAEEQHVIIAQGTERPFTGKYWDHFESGTYVCRQCGAELYRSAGKFRSDCGWPSFDEELPGAVKRRRDADGSRTEILCSACDGHLGHVFEGERLTPKNVRHCVNSVSLVFRPETQITTQAAIFAGGCFWGVEHHFNQAEGVLSATSGYTGGKVADPTYEQICTGRTGHAEAVRVVFDPERTSYEQLARVFFEIHDPTQLNRQGPDRGTQYRSAVFYRNEQQKQIAEKLITQLRDNGYNVVTQVMPTSEFYPAEAYHQDYLEQHPGRPTCHVRVPRFDRPDK